MALTPLVSFKHTLQEISVNRDDPCEVIRELISNSYDAGANDIRIFPILNLKAFAFFDNGSGLSETQRVNDILPYQAFFSIGCSTKQKGASTVGYKCQGSKLCFAAEQFALITRCENEPFWRWKLLHQPWKRLHENVDIASAETTTPWKVLKDEIFAENSDEVSQLLAVLNEDFFADSFKKGTLLCVQGFRDDRFADHFNTIESPAQKKFSYLRQYIRMYTSHGDVRRIGNEGYGFSRSDANAVTSLVSANESASLKVWAPNVAPDPLAEVPSGWPYLKAVLGTVAPDSPTEVAQLSHGRFHSRHATVFEYEGRKYSLILAVDGRRKALEQYSALDRQGPHGRRSGLKFGDQRGVFLCSRGIRVCSHNDLLSHPVLDRWSVLMGATGHFTLHVDGWFDLITNRNGLSTESKAVLNASGFVENIKRFLDDAASSPSSTLFQLEKRLTREQTEETLNRALERQEARRSSLKERERFRVQELGDYIIPAPSPGEEHYVGALYTLFSHLVKPTHELKKRWPRALTFAGLGIDAMVTISETSPFEDKNLKFVEYKYSMRISDEYNHPLEYTHAIICWNLLDAPPIGSTMTDMYEATTKVKETLSASDGTKFGYVLGDVGYPNGKVITTEIPVIGLRQLLDCTFQVTWLPGAKQPSGRKLSS